MPAEVLRPAFADPHFVHARGGLIWIKPLPSHRPLLSAPAVRDNFRTPTCPAASGMVGCVFLHKAKMAAAGL